MLLIELKLVIYYYNVAPMLLQTVNIAQLLLVIAILLRNAYFVTIIITDKDIKYYTNEFS